MAAAEQARRAVVPEGLEVRERALVDHAVDDARLNAVEAEDDDAAALLVARTAPDRQRQRGEREASGRHSSTSSSTDASPGTPMRSGKP
jgi:hypothetical protein